MIDVKQYTIGDLTHRYVFIQHDLTNLHDMQAVLDAVEKALAWTSPDPVPQKGVLAKDNPEYQRLTGLIREGEQARIDGTPCPYDGQSIEHALHATGWVNKDLRLALDATKANPAVKHVKPLDLSNLLRHAFFTGMGYDDKSRINEQDQQKWVRYSPMESETLNRVWAALYPDVKLHWQDDVTKAPVPVEAIPEGIYFSREHGNFYGSVYHGGQGVEFYNKWFGRREEFPDDPRKIDAPEVTTNHDAGREWKWTRTTSNMNALAKYECQVFGGVYSIARTPRLDGWALAFQSAPGMGNMEGLSVHTLFQDAATRAVAHYDSGAATKATAVGHDLYETGDADAPDVIKDRNGEVVLGLCKVCNKGEAELAEPCAEWTWTQAAPSVYVHKVQDGPGYSVVLVNGDWQALVVEHGSAWGTVPRLIALRNTAADAMRECEHEFKTRVTVALANAEPLQAIRPPESFQAALADANAEAEKAFQELEKLRDEIAHRFPIFWAMEHKHRKGHYWIATQYDKEDANWGAPFRVYK